MKSDYERNRYRIKYFFLFSLFLILSVVWIWFSWRAFTWKTIGLLVLFLLFSLFSYWIFYHSLDGVYSEIENLSAMMEDMMENGDEVSEEEYKEGAVGVLYTNFYKMVTVLKQSKKQEQDEKYFLRDIISDISHQLKTPLSSLRVFVDLLLEDKVEDKEKQRQILEEAGNQLNRMEWMILSMLKLARIEAGAIQFERKEILLQPLLMQAGEGISFLLKERNQKLMVDCDKDISILCDGDWLVEAIINLLKNASDYSGHDKPIRIEVEQTRVYTRIYVKDEGPGIPEQEIPNIFKRFYRVHQEVNPNSVGIGLSLTKSIVEGMEGSIHVKSEEGKYTWFILTFVQ